MHFRKRPDHRVVHVIIDEECGESQGQSHVDSMCPGDYDPRGMKPLLVIFELLIRAGLGSPSKSSGLPRSTMLNRIGNQQMAGDEKVEKTTDQNVFALI